MDISTTVLNTALSSQFLAGGRTYSVYLTITGSISETTPEAITFTTPSGGSTNLSSSVFFSIASGDTVTGLKVKNDLDVILIDESVSPSETFSSNGTFTINNIIVTLTD
jgi:hypothetical protein